MTRTKWLDERLRCMKRRRDGSEGRNRRRLVGKEMVTEEEVGL